MISPTKRFLVVENAILGVTLPGCPLSVQVVSMAHDAPCCRPGGMYPLALDPAWVRSSDCPKPLDLAAVGAGKQEAKFDPARVRPATRGDFERFRLSTNGYENDPAYEMPECAHSCP